MPAVSRPIDHWRETVGTIRAAVGAMHSVRIRRNTVPPGMARRGCAGPRASELRAFARVALSFATLAAGICISSPATNAACSVAGTVSVSPTSIECGSDTPIIVTGGFVWEGNDGSNRNLMANHAVHLYIDGQQWSETLLTDPAGKVSRVIPVALSAGLAPGPHTFSLEFQRTETPDYIRNHPQGSGCLVLPQYTVAQPAILQVQARGRTPANVGPVTFSPTRIDSNALASVSFQNTGCAPLTISGVKLVGSHPGDFTVQSYTNSTPVNGNAQVQGRFTPKAKGPRSAVMEISHDGAGGTLRVDISGEGRVGPVLEVDPANLAFGDQRVNSASAARSVIVRNVGDEPLQINNVSLSGAATSYSFVNNVQGALSAGGQGTISITFKPTARGAQNATLSIASNGGTRPVTLTGMGIEGPRKIRLSHSHLVFSAQVNQPRQDSVRIENVGNETVTLESVSLVGHGAFSLVSGGERGSLARGNGRNVSIRFHPGSAGTYQGELTIVSDAEGSPHRVSLVGTTIVDTRLISVSPGPLDFGEQALGSAGGSRPVSITSTGTAALQVTGISLSGSHPGDFQINGGAGPVVLQTGQTRTVSVLFSPKAEGLRTASLVIDSDAENGRQVVTLRGTGTPPPLSMPGTWATHAPTGHAVSLSIDAQGKLTVWAVSQDRQTVRHSGQGALANGAFSIALPDGILLSGQVSADQSSASVTAQRAGVALLSANAPRLSDVAPLPGNLAGTYIGLGTAANGDQLQIQLTVAPGGHTTLHGVVNRPGVAASRRQFGTLFVTAEGKLIRPLVAGDGSLSRPVPNSPIPGTIDDSVAVATLGGIQATSNGLVLTYEFRQADYVNAFQVPLLRR
jgi:hypothetical protein